MVCSCHESVSSLPGPHAAPVPPRHRHGPPGPPPGPAPAGRAPRLRRHPPRLGSPTGPVEVRTESQSTVPSDEGSNRGKSARPERAILYEVAFERLQADFDDVRRSRLADVDEPLPIGSLDLDVDVAVRVRPVEDATGRVVDARLSQRVFAAGAEPLSRLAIAGR